MPGLDSNTKLLLHCDGTDGSTTFTDVSDSAHTVNVTATAEVDTAFKKWGTGAALFDGDSGYFAIDTSADWNILGSNSDDWTIDFWVKHADHVNIEGYMEHYEDDNNRWVLFNQHGEGMRFTGVSGGGLICDTGMGTEISDTNWHHVALCKVANKYGLYLGGTQTAYVLDNTVDTFTGSLNIGRSAHTSGPLYLQGHQDEIRIQHSNYFGAAPADAWGNGETPDTITVPPSSYAWDLSIDVHDCTDLKEKVGG